MLEKTVGSDVRGHAAVPSRWAQLLNDQRLVALFFLLPTILVLCFVVIYPFFSAISISFQDKMIGGTASYIGLGNYYELFGDRVFLKVIRNTIIYTLVAVALKFLLGLAMALVLAQDRRLNFLYPDHPVHSLGGADDRRGAELRWIYDDFSGLYNNLLLALFDMGDVISWLGDPNLAMGSVIAVVIWSGTPFYTMSFLAGLKAIPNELYEAARIDGASVWQEFWHITVPQMRKVFVIVVMLSTIWTSTNLVIVQILTNGGPANATQIMPNLSYKYALLAGRLGIGSAVNMVFFPLLAILIYILSRRMLARRD